MSDSYAEWLEDAEGGCVECGVRFNGIKALEKHMKEKHAKDKSTSLTACKDCEHFVYMQEGLGFDSTDCPVQEWHWCMGKQVFNAYDSKWSKGITRCECVNTDGRCPYFASKPARGEKKCKKG